MAGELISSSPRGEDKDAKLDEDATAVAGRPDITVLLSTRAVYAPSHRRIHYISMRIGGGWWSPY
jgi:hypothetical protein